MPPATNIRVPDLTRLDLLALEKELGKDNVSVEMEERSGDAFHELATITAVVIVSLAALRVLAVHLARKHERREFTVVAEIEAADGSRKRVTISSKEANRGAPDAQVLEQLAKACDVDISALVQGP